MPPKARQESALPTLSEWVLSSRSDLSTRTVSESFLILFTRYSSIHSPKPTLPPASAYEPTPDAQRELGPPPPNFGRFGDFNQPMHRPDGSSFVPRRNLDEVMCFKVSNPSALIRVTDNLSSADNMVTMRINVEIAMFPGIEEG